jgi:hypothetical protein
MSSTPTPTQLLVRKKITAIYADGSSKMNLGIATVVRMLKGSTNVPVEVAADAAARKLLAELAASAGRTVERVSAGIFRVFKSYDDILDHCCFAWSKLIDMPWKIMSIGTRDWVLPVMIIKAWYKLLRQRYSALRGGHAMIKITSLPTIAAALLACGLSAPAQAGPNRTWVSGHGTELYLPATELSSSWGTTGCCNVGSVTDFGIANMTAESETITIAGPRVSR